MSSPQRPTRKPPAPNQRSKLLSNEENETVFKFLENRCQSLATAVVEVYGTVGPHHNVWTKLICGVVTFTKDNNRKSFYIQVFDMNVHNMVYEQELYREFTYHESKEFFHQYEGDERTIGLNFADREEAEKFAREVKVVLENRRKKKTERRQQVMHDQQRLMKQQQNMQQQQQLQMQQQQHQPQQKPKKEKEEKYRTLRGIKKTMDIFGTVREKKPRKTLDIGMPTNFVHVSHAGLDNNFNIDGDLMQLLANMGLDKNQMAQPETQKFVYDFIEKQVGGDMNEVRRMNQKLSQKRNRGAPPEPPSPRSPHHRAPPPAPTSAPPPAPTLRSNKKAPRPPIREIFPESKAPTPPPQRRAPAHRYPDRNDHLQVGNRSPPAPSLSGGSRPLPPPPPPQRQVAPPVPPAGRRGPPIPPPPPMPSAGAPPPTPPPPYSGGGVRPPPPPMPTSTARPPTDARSALLDQIRSGPSGGLKHVAHNPSERAAPKDSRSELLATIRSRDFNLNHVEIDDRRQSISEEPPLLEGWALDLQRALQKREQFIQSEDSDNDADDDDDDEWDDSD